VVVHDVKVNPVGTSGDDVLHFLAQAGEVGGQNRGGDAVGFAHDVIILLSARASSGVLLDCPKDEHFFKDKPWVSLN
jgi:hypothetical protein